MLHVLQSTRLAGSGSLLMLQPCTQAVELSIMQGEVAQLGTNHCHLLAQ